MYPMLHQSIALLPTSSQNNNIYKHSNQRELYNFSPSHLPYNYVIYLLECIMCKIQYVEKSETSFNIKLNNHRKDIKKANATEACKHFNNSGRHGKFIINEQLRNINTTPTETLKLRLKDRENF